MLSGLNSSHLYQDRFQISSFKMPLSFSGFLSYHFDSDSWDWGIGRRDWGHRQYWSGHIESSEGKAFHANIASVFTQFIFFS